MKTLEQYLVDAVNRSGPATTHVLTLKQRTFEGFNVAGDPVLSPPCFYIHPIDVDGDTLDFQVTGNQLSQDPNVSYVEDVEPHQY